MGYTRLFQAAGYCLGTSLGTSSSSQRFDSVLLFPLHSNLNLLAGILFKYVDRAMAMVGGMIALGITTILMPLIPSYVAFSVLSTLFMLVMGEIDLGTNTCEHDFSQFQLGLK